MNNTIETLTKDMVIENIDDIDVDLKCQDITILFNDGSQERYWLPMVSGSDEEDGNWTEVDYDNVPDNICKLMDEQEEDHYMSDEMCRSHERRQMGIC